MSLPLRIRFTYNCTDECGFCTLTPEVDVVKMLEHRFVSFPNSLRNIGKSSFRSYSEKCFFSVALSGFISYAEKSHPISNVAPVTFGRNGLRISSFHSAFVWHRHTDFAAAVLRKIDIQIGHKSCAPRIVKHFNVSNG